MKSSRQVYNLALLLTLIGIVMFGACSEDVNDKLPQTISSFVNKYYPNSPVSSFSESKGGEYTVVIRNGAVLQFNSDMAWTSINGNGVPLPPMMIMDECPDPLYRYIEEMERTSGVYALSRTDKIYRVEFLDTYITYTIATGQVTYPQTT